MYSNGAATEQCTFVGIAKDSRAVVITDDGKIKWLSPADLVVI
jgi:hypothetical protein